MEFKFSMCDLSLLPNVNTVMIIWFNLIFYF